MIEQQLLDKVIDLYEKSYINNYICVSVNANILDVENPSIWINKGMMDFEFNDTEAKDFSINLDDIVSITFKQSGNATLSTIKTKNDETIIVHNM